MSVVQTPPTQTRREIAVLIVSVFVVSTCAIFYELLISTTSSYFLGSSVLQFSITIGLFMFFMGVGSFLSKYVVEDLLRRFIFIETIIGIVGGLSVLVLHAAFTFGENYYLVMFLLIAAVSTLVGLEIPLVVRIARTYHPLKDAVANVLAFDYLGALVASILFPLVLLPYLGLVRTACVVGLLNLAIAFVTAREFRHLLKPRPLHSAILWLGVCVVGLGFIGAAPLSEIFDRFLYQDEIVLSAQSKYQKIVLTRYRDDIHLYLNGDLQFSSADEYRYHESLVHIPMALATHREQVLMLGAGDGLAAREVLKYGEVKSLTIVDIDSQVTELARTHPLLRELNHDSLRDARVEVRNEDAWKFVERAERRFNVVIIDLPDPNDLALGRLYSVEFYKLLKRSLAKDGVIVTQSTSPYFAREAFWSIHNTLAEVFPSVLPYQTYVPSFGLWGFNLASDLPLAPPKLKPAVAARFLGDAIPSSLFEFESDTSQVEAEVNRLENQALVRAYEASVENWN